MFAAEGNPDEEKIGAFGVGESHHFVPIPLGLTYYRVLQSILRHGRTFCDLRR